MVRCQGKTTQNTSCHKHTTNDNHYCHLHQAQVPIGECPVCTEPLTNVDVLSCTHRVHKVCVKNAVDQLQDILLEEGYPIQQYGKCPICRTEQRDIPAKHPSWYGTITIYPETMKSLLETLRNHKGWISKEYIPNEILEQMHGAAEEEQLLFANTTASLLWLAEYQQVPQKMRFTQYHRGYFRSHIIFN